jgi:hypothetical protein
MKIFNPFLIALFTFVPVALSAPDKSMEEVIDGTASFLVRDWVTDPEFEDYNPPQVLSIDKGTKVYGGCGSYIHGDEVAGSSYCPLTNTIFLEPDQLTFFYENFGPSSVAYVVAHEFGHAIQARYGDLEGGSEVELQADCLAGVLIDIGSEKLGITRKDTVQMAQAAYAIGDPTHGTGAQRTYALLSGMGVMEAGCTKKEMLALKNDQISDPAYKKLMTTRSGTAGIDIDKTPYPKTLNLIRDAL